MTVTGVELLGNTGALRVLRVSLAAGEVPPWRRSTSLPMDLAAGKALWITWAVALTRCRARASIDRVRLDYSVLGLDTSQTVVPLHATTLSCEQGA